MYLISEELSSGLAELENQVLNFKGNKDKEYNFFKAKKTDAKNPLRIKIQINKGENTTKSSIYQKINLKAPSPAKSSSEEEILTSQANAKVLRPPSA